MDRVLCQQYLSDLSLVGFERNTKGRTISGIDTPPPPQREVFVGVLGMGGEGSSHRANESCFCTVIIPSQEAKNVHRFEWFTLLSLINIFIVISYTGFKTL